MEEPQNAVYQQKEEEKNPVIIFFTNLFSAIKLPFPQKNKKNDGAKIEPAAAEPVRIQPAEVESESNNLSVVTFPRQTFAPVKLEAETEGAERTTNPVILWQVYAIGGYYILRWAWGKWNEHKGPNRSDDEPPRTPPPALD